MKFCCISDTHSFHRLAKIPKCDFLLHSGDITQRGEIETVKDFLNWLQEQPARYKIFIAGNHDLSFQDENGQTMKIVKQFVSNNPNCFYLQDSGVEIEGIRFWGSPWQPWFGGWAFNLHRGPDIRAKWNLIPADTEILLTHGPPMLRLDATRTGERVGCEDLANRIQSALPQLKLHVFGHIHEGYGITQDYNTGLLSVNAAFFNASGRPGNDPFLLEF